MQLRADADSGNEIATFGAWQGANRVATLVILVDAAASVLRVTVAEPARCTSAECAELLDAVLAHASSIPVDAVEIATVDPLLRHQAGRAGFERRLRGPLRRRVDAAGRDDAAASLDEATPGPADAEGLATALASLVGVAIDPAPASSWLSRLARGAVAGFGDMVRWRVDPGDGRPTLVVMAPNRDDLIVESLALTVDVALAVRRRFGSAIDHLRTVSFDHSSHGLKGGHYAGQANPNASIISLNASYVLARLVDEARSRQAAGPADPSGGGAYFPPPYTSLERTTAHELWHQIEATFEARRYRESVEFRRQLGQHLGVETLEHAIRGRQSGSPPAWQAAQRQLVEEVSDYGGTLRGEATAEMFAQWWCPIREPSPAVSIFAKLVDRAFPPSG